MAGPTDVFLLIEVAEDSRRYDLGEKAKLYADAGIQEYWVVDVERQAIHVHRRPQAGGYADITVKDGDEVASPLRLEKNQPDKHSIVWRMTSAKPAG